MRAFLLSIATFISLLTPSAAQANFCLGACGGLYMGAFGGAGVTENISISILDSSVPATTFYEEKFDPGSYTGLITLGFQCPNGFSIEAEGGYRRIEVKDYKEFGGAIITGDGDMNIFTGMINLMFRSSFCDCFFPFVGGGLGAAWFDLNDNTVSGTISSFDEEDTPFAWQFFAGIEYYFADYCSFSIQYRNLSLEEMDFEVSPSNDVLSTKHFMHIHELLIGIRVIFAE